MNLPSIRVLCEPFAIAFVIWEMKPNNRFLLRTSKDVIRDYELCYASRQVSFLGRKEVLAGRAKFSILGGGKELPQVVLSKFFKKGDFRSGYYRDQTWALAAGFATIEDLFAQLYGDIDNDRFSSGRQMNNHF